MFPVPTARLVVVAAVLALVVLARARTDPDGACVAAVGVMALGGLADAILVTDPSRVGVQRDLPGTVTLGSSGGRGALAHHQSAPAPAPRRRRRPARTVVAAPGRDASGSPCHRKER